MKTFIIIKPDAVYRNLVGKILSRFEQAGTFIFKIEMRFKGEEWFYEHYEHLIRQLPPDYFEEMIKDTVNCPLIGVILGSDIGKVHLMIGATNCLEAAPGTIRGDFGRNDNYCNLIHASDSEEAVDKEIQLFFRSDNDS